MAASEKSLRICSKGHRYYKSSDCNVCPICEKKRIPEEGFFVTLSRPARRALANAGIDSPKKLSRFRESEILALHGIGKDAIQKLHAVLVKHKLRFKAD